jgi:hypothetical protein
MTETVFEGTRDRQAFSELISLAEEIQRRRESLQQRLAVSIAAIVGFAAVAASFGFSFFGFYGVNWYYLLVTIAIVSYAALSYFSYVYLRQMRREKRAFSEVMTVVHELVAGLRSDLSPLEFAQIQVRLSRLDN